MRLGEYIQAGADRLSAAGVECIDPKNHMLQVAQLALGMSRASLCAHADDILSEEKTAALDTTLERRLQGEPLQYIAGETSFWKSTFEVGPGVLIPRPETELLVEQCLSWKSSQPLRVAELGAGSGNIGISVISERPDWSWYAFELNSQSYQFANNNRQRLLPQENRYFLVSGDFFERARDFAPYDAVVSNPPYIDSHEISSLSKEVQREPRLALDGGMGGTRVFERLAATAKEILRPGGDFLSEIGSDQGEATVKILVAQGFKEVRLIKDLSDRYRLVAAKVAQK